MTPEEIEKKAKELRKVNEEIDGILGDAVSELETAASGLWKALYPILKQRYEEAKKPHGDTEEGFLRWLHDRAENAALAQKAQDEPPTTPGDEDAPPVFDKRRLN